MRFVSGALSFLAAAALSLPYATPALCTALRPDPEAAHETCEPTSGSSIVAGWPDASCDLGECATALTAPPESDFPTLAILPSHDVAEPEPVATVLGDPLAPPTPPPQL